MKKNFVHSTAIIYDNVILGEGNYIGAYCVIGSPAEWKGKGMNTGNVVIGNNNIITGLVTIDSGVEKPTTIGDNCYIMKHAHVGHDAVLEDNVTLSCGAKIGGHSTICENTNIGLNAVVHQKCFVPKNCMIGASAFIGKKTIMKEGQKYAGVPAKWISENIKK